MKDCIFCKIINGEIKAHKVYEDDFCLAFLDVHPATDGHILVIPKKHYENIFDVQNDDLHRLSDAVKKVSEKLKTNFNATGVNILNASGVDAQQSIFHLHIHVIPRFKDDKVNLWFKEQQQIVVNLDDVAKKITGGKNERRTR